MGSLQSYLSQWGITADEIDLVSDQGGVQIYSHPPVQPGRLIITEHRVTPRSIDPVEPSSADERPTARAAQRVTVTDPPQQGDLQALIDRCSAVLKADRRAKVSSPKDAERRATLEGLANLGLIDIRRAGATVIYSPSALLLALEAALTPERS